MLDMADEQVVTEPKENKDFIIQRLQRKAAEAEERGYNKAMDEVRAKVAGKKIAKRLNVSEDVIRSFEALHPQEPVTEEGVREYAARLRIQIAEPQSTQEVSPDANIQ